jgi:hypothetical protein
VLALASWDDLLMRCVSFQIKNIIFLDLLRFPILFIEMNFITLSNILLSSDNEISLKGKKQIRESLKEKKSLLLMN